MHPLVRLLGALALLGVLGGLCVHYGDDTLDHSPYPGTDELATDYGSYVGQETVLFGTVQSVEADTDRARISVDSDEGTFEMTVVGVTEQVRTGGFVQVYGTLEAGQVIDATEVAVVNGSGGSEAYKYAVSAVGAVLVLALFFRRWRFDAEAVAFEARADDREGPADG